MNNAVAIAALTLARRGFRLGPITATVRAGGRLAVVGPSGSGKTTLLRCIAGLDSPDGGTIRIGERLAHGGPRPLPPDRRGVGLVFQDGALWPHLTALQHLRFAAPGFGRAAAEQLLTQGGLAHLAGRRPAAMSGGEAQRLGLLRALAARPEVLLLDEPLRSVDVHQRDALVLLLLELADARALTTILVTHDRDEALALATDLVVLRAGRVVEAGPAAELLRAPATAFTAAFLGGAACLPTGDLGDGTVATPFGPMPRPTACPRATELRLALLPGDVAVVPAAAAHPPIGRVLSVRPAAMGFAVRVALGDQIVTATAAAALAVGELARLTLVRPPRLLPWDRGDDDHARDDREFRP